MIKSVSRDAQCEIFQDPQLILPENCNSLQLWQDDQRGPAELVLWATPDWLIIPTIKTSVPSSSFSSAWSELKFQNSAKLRISDVCIMFHSDSADTTTEYYLTTNVGIVQTSEDEDTYYRGYCKHIQYLISIWLLTVSRLLKLDLSLQLKRIQIPVSALLAFLHSWPWWPLTTFLTLCLCTYLSSYSFTTISMATVTSPMVQQPIGYVDIVANIITAHQLQISVQLFYHHLANPLRPTS